MVSRADKKYEVERILRAIVIYKRGRRINWKYLVKWKGYTDKDNTWEPSESFEDSPKLIVNFWKKVDTGGRDPKSAGSFTLREELAPRDGESLTSSDTKGEEEEKKEGEEEESASPKTLGRKRSATSTGKTATKRKRGRPSKAVKDAEEHEESDGDGDGDAASRRNSRRLSEKTEILSNAELRSEGKVKKFLHLASASASDSEGEGLPGSPISKETAREGVRRSLKKKKRAYIESDEDERAADALHSDAEGSSHDGSLFSGDDEQEQEDQAKVTGVPGVPEPIVRPKITPAPEVSQKEKKARGGKPAKPRVQMIEDPNINKALEARMRARLLGQSANATGQTSESGSAAGPANDGRGATSLSPSKPARNESGSYRPSLLTFEKGKLVSQRRKEITIAVQGPISSKNIYKELIDTVEEPPMLSAPVASSSDLMVPVVREPQDDLAMDAAKASEASGSIPVDAGAQEPDVMDTSPDFGSQANTSTNDAGQAEAIAEVSADPLPTGPPPTADELLSLAGVRDEQDDLPDFQAGEVIDDDASPVIAATSAAASIPEATSSNSERTPGALAFPEAGAWKQSTIFGFPTPTSIFQKILAASSSEPPPPAKPTKLIVPLRLDPTSSVPIILKDIAPALSGPKLADLLMLDHDGPPGKLFPLDVLQHVRVGGSSARIAPDEECSDEQRLWLSKLVDELEKGVLFIVVIGGHSFALCCSSHREATQRLGLPSSLIGLSKAAVIQHIAIVDNSLYANFAIAAQELKLR